MICPNAGPLGRTIAYPEFWVGVLTAPRPFGGVEYTFPAYLADRFMAAFPALDVRVVSCPVHV